MLGSLVTIQKKEEGATSLTADEDFTMHSTEKKRGKKKNVQENLSKDSCYTLRVFTCILSRTLEQV